ncbi:MAG: FAD-dependent oxidoreductase, partial [Desulfovibrio sp.]|nr:FAD-dependent oxidoreductase [Desulfovibrio sp.]
QNLDYPVQIGALGLESQDAKAPKPRHKSGRKVAVIGGGPAGLACAWRLARRGHEVEVFEAGPAMGGKMEQAIPRERLPEALLQKEIARIRDMGVAFRVNCRVDRAKFAEIRASHDAVVVAAGGHVGRIFNWPGRERCRAGIDFMKAVNRGLKPKVAEQVVVIGAGNAGMDAAAGAYRMGARKVTCIDVQKPAAFEHEMARIRALGGEIVWPCATREITAEGVICEDGRFFPAGDVIVAVGETPDLSFLPEGAPMFRAWLAPGAGQQILEGVFAAGDCIKPGLIASAIGSGNRAADACDAWLKGQPYVPEEGCAVAQDRLHVQWFAKFRKDDLPKPKDDHVRCISCGSCRDCGTCLECCPEGAISRKALPGGGFEYVSDPERCIGCGMCQGVCPCGAWTMRPNDPLAQ